MVHTVCVACGSVWNEYKVSFGFGTPVELHRFIKVDLNETCSEVCIDKCLCCYSHTQKGYILSPSAGEPKKSACSMKERKLLDYRRDYFSIYGFSCAYQINVCGDI
jgi:hypothetical protein